MTTKIQTPPSDQMLIVYYGDLADPDHLRKVVITGTRAVLSVRQGITDPSPSGEAYDRAGANYLYVGEVIPDAEELALRDGVRALGGRVHNRGGTVRHGGDLGEVLALAERLWGSATGTATEYGQQPTLLGQGG